MEFLKRALTLEQWAVLLDAAAAQHATLKATDPPRAAKLQAVLDGFKAIGPGVFVEIRVGSNTLAD